MVNKEKLNKLYDGVVSGDELTTKKLGEYGFNKNDITKLLNENILERVKKGYYSFISAPALVERGKEFYQSREYMKVNKYFDKSYEIDPTNRDVLLQFLLNSIAKDNYELSFRYLDDLYKNAKDKEYIVENNLILFLLSINNELPERYKAYFEKLNLEHFFVDEMDENISDVEKIQNKKSKIKHSILNYRFSLAFTQISEYNEMVQKSDTYSFVLKRLMSKIYKNEETLIKEIIKQVEDEKYEEALEVINKMISKAHRFSVYNISDSHLGIIRNLLQAIIRINDTHIIPDKIPCQSAYFSDLVKTRNFDLALIQQKDKIDQDFVSNVIYKLLLIIDNKIKEIENEEAKANVEEEKVAVEEEKNTETIDNDLDKPSEYYFGEIINCLLMGDIDRTLKCLTIYLKKINMEKYRDLIANLIKISLIDGDKSFSKPITTLIDISKGNLGFSSLDFVKCFYESLNNSEFDKAQIYIDILGNKEIFSQDNLSVNNLKLVLETYIQNNNSKIKPEETFDTYSRNTHDNSEVSKEETFDLETPSFGDPSPDFTHSKSNAINDEEDNIMNGRINKLKKNGIIILKHVNSLKTQKILEEVEKMPDVVAFTINVEAEERVVLRYRLSKYINVKQVLEEAKALYDAGDYESAIEEYKKTLRMANPNYFIYASLGFCYMKLKQNSMAIDYFNIANYLAKQENKKADYTKLIDMLTGEYFSEDRKEEVKMSLVDFDSDIDLSYGIDNIEDMKNDIKLGRSIDEVADDFNLTQEQKLVFMLMLAKEYYYDENYDLGDSLLKKVEKTKGKTKAVMSLFEEVRKNKKFYKNRVRTRK